MKTVKNSTSKKTKKAVKPTYTIDLTDVSSIEEAEIRIALTKYEAGVELNSANIVALKNYAKSLCMTYAISEMIKADRIYVLGAGVVFATKRIDGPIVDIDVEVKKKKSNIFKRFWNWITRKK